jgi:hypothetical protein
MVASTAPARVDVTWEGRRVVVIITPNTGATTSTGPTAYAYFADDYVTILRQAAERIEPPPVEPPVLLPPRLRRPPWRPPALAAESPAVPRLARGAQAKRADVMLARRGCRGR